MERQFLAGRMADPSRVALDEQLLRLLPGQHSPGAEQSGQAGEAEDRPEGDAVGIHRVIRFRGWDEIKAGFFRSEASGFRLRVRWDPVPDGRPGVRD